MVVVNTTSTIDPINMYDNINNFFLNPKVIIIILIIIIIYIAMFSSTLGSKNTQGEQSSTSKLLGFIIVIILGALIIINAFQYFLNVNISAYLKGFFNPTVKQKQIDIVVNTKPMVTSPSVPEIKFKKQVYNIPGNHYTYNDAKALCTAYGSELATYEQIEDAYNSGGEWCNYGWSDNQLALFPTQLDTYNNLQNIKGHEHDCGRPGVNGGYIANPKVRFGVNCYGNKPKITSQEQELMEISSPYPETMQEKIFQDKVDYWKQNLSTIQVSPFNHDTWGEL
jgi:hypothetical protein